MKHPFINSSHPLPSLISRAVGGLFVSLFISFQIQAQTVSGRVISEENQEALPGVNVLVKGTTSGTVTDLDGNYQLSATGDDTLSFSYIGFMSREVPVDNRSTVDVALSEDVETLSEVVVVGYGTQQKRDLTGSISSLDGEELTTVPSQSPVQGLQGKVAGVQVTSSSGAPGAAPFVRIRGTGTLNDASPLFVVDGVLLRNPEDINYLNSSDIKSMEVLKDASATAIYGARGANGVVIITTKSGKAGETRVNANVSYGLQTIPNKIDLLDGPQFRQLANEIDPVAFPLEDVPSTDWQEEVFDEPAGLLDANLSVSGGSEKVSFYVAAGYFNQAGVVPSSDFQRFTLRLNNTYSLTENIKIGHNFSVARSVQNREPGGIINTLYRARPDVNPFTPEGDFAEVPSLANPLATIEFNNDENVSTDAVGNMFLEVTLGESFTARSSFGIDAGFNRSVNFTPVFFVSPQQQNRLSTLTNRRAEDTRWFWENTLNYNHEFGVHRVSGLVGYTLQSERNEFLESRTKGIFRPDEEL